MKQKHVFILIAVLLAVAVAVLAIKAKQDNRLASRASRATEFGGTAKSNPEEIGKLNNEILTLSEKSETTTQVQNSQNIAQLKAALESRAAKIQLLVVESPDAALAVMLPPKAIADITQQVPVEAGKFLEQIVTINNVELKVVHIDHFDENDLTKSTGEIQYSIIRNDSEQRLYLAGGELELVSSTVANINGYQLPSGSILAASGAGSLQVVSVPTSESGGEQKTLTVLVNFADSGPVPFTKEQAQELVFNGPMQKYYRENSYSKTWFSGDVVGWYTLPRNGLADGYCQWPNIYYGNDDFGSLFKRDGINLANYGRILILASHPCMGGGFSSVGKWDHYLDGQVYKLSDSWVGSLDSYSQPSYMPGLPTQWRYIDFVLAHELGHALGVVHANSWNCSVGILYGDYCRHQEYGNYYDTMGSGIYSLNFNAYFKDALGWLKNNVISVGDTKGSYLTYTLLPLESPNGSRAISITPPGMTKPSYYVEYRTSTGYDSNLKDPGLVSNTSGVFVNWVPEKGQWAPMSRLLDMTPGNWSWDNVVLAQGKEYTDYGRGVSIKLETKAIKNNTAKVMVKTFKPVCQNIAPSFSNFYSSGFQVIPGYSIFTSFSVLNPDSPSCLKSLFKVEILPPSGWSAYSYPEDRFDLEPGAYNYGYAITTTPSDAVGGDYSGTIRATKYKSDGITIDKIAEMPFYVHVIGTTPTPTIPPPPPHK